MRQKVYVVYTQDTMDVANNLCDKIFVNKHYRTDNAGLTCDILRAMAVDAMCEFFYVITPTSNIVFDDFDFSFKPETWDAKYMHIWNNDTTVRLFHTNSVLASPEKYTDEDLKVGNARIKNITQKIYSFPVFDIVFLSYDEEYAETNYTKLKSRFPKALHVHGVKGILEAHKVAAQHALLNNSTMFYVVDADAEILPSFDFTYRPNSYDNNSVHVWHARNPVNDLEYGYGGIKLFPTKSLISYTGLPVDFTTSVSEHFKVMPSVSNITKFNTDPFSAWRSGFRECAKLASKVIPLQYDEETAYRLDTWCTKGGDRDYGEFTMQGANEGAKFGKMYFGRPEMIMLINDFQWLAQRFSS